MTEAQKRIIYEQEMKQAEEEYAKAIELAKERYSRRMERAAEAFSNGSSTCSACVGVDLIKTRG